MMLRGRNEQCRLIDALIAEARSGRSRVMVLRGEPGIGKSALMQYAAETGPDFHVARADGVESEMELPYAAVHQLCRPMLDHLDRLPEPQAAALRIAFGLRAGPPPDRFLVSLAVLSLLSGQAESQPLLCLIDDAQWLDQASAQTLAFVARRLYGESVAFLVGIRDGDETDPFAGLPEVNLTGLADVDARTLLMSAIPGKLDRQVSERIVAESAGNPLALLELPHGWSAEGLAGGFGLPQSVPVRDRVEASFRRRIATLPAPTRMLLLVAAADPQGDPALLWRAASDLGIGFDAAAPAEREGLVSIGARVAFRHPLVRSAIYRTAPVADRQNVHRALAGATDAARDPDRRAWHRAQSASGPDEDIAAELEQSAARAKARGGLAAAAAFLESASMLTPDPATRGSRALSAAQLKFDAGAPEKAMALLANAASAPLSALQRALLERLGARITFSRLRADHSVSDLLAAAKKLEPLDSALARETYLEALWAAMRIHDGSGKGLLAAAAAAALGAAHAPQPPRAVDLLLDGLAIQTVHGYAASVPVLERALDAFLSQDISEDDTQWLWLACNTAMGLWDDESCRSLARRQVRISRDAGSLRVLPLALNYLAGHHMFAGEFDDAQAVIEEADTIAAITGNAPVEDFSVLLAAWRGHAPQVPVSHDPDSDSQDMLSVNREFADAVLHNGLGQYAEALSAARQAAARDVLGYGSWVLPELIEAAVRSGDSDAARTAFAQLDERTMLSTSAWARGIRARSQALITEGPGAERHYIAAIELLGKSRMVVHHARAHLIYGEWLRRQRRRVDARTSLRMAENMFKSMGAEAFAARADRELLATGERTQKRTGQSTPQLTAQERQIARLAYEGRSNTEIAGQLFISARTVEYHFGKIFSKLGIASRHELTAEHVKDSLVPRPKTKRRHLITPQ